LDWEDQVRWILDRFIEILDFSEQVGFKFSAYCMALNYAFTALLMMIKRRYGEKIAKQIIKYALEDVEELEKFLKTQLKEGRKWQMEMIS